ncbi:hypothetical protein D0N36_03680 [Hymenobacter lapidiphilus]|nr:hypothetical protein D0N36_03680 [Hymenobacter sp. CCM 8763]
MYARTRMYGLSTCKPVATDFKALVFNPTFFQKPFDDLLNLRFSKSNTFSYHGLVLLTIITLNISKICTIFILHDVLMTL